jgi:predicted TIM-barrel fold metal-dependent hydrolase
MKIKALSLLTLIICSGECIGQTPGETLPVIDMHIHMYSGKNYNKDLPVPIQTEPPITAPETCREFNKEIAAQLVSNNIVLSYVSGDFEVLDSLHKTSSGKFLLSAEIWPTRELMKDGRFLYELESRIKKGEIRGIGEVLNMYQGIAPNDPVMDTLYRIAVRYDLPVAIHFGLAPPGSQLNGFPDMRIEYGNPVLMLDVLIKYPKLRLNIMHAGLPLYADEAFAMMNMFPDVYADIGAMTWVGSYERESVKDFLIRACKYGFSDRIMFGSDEMIWPGAISLAVEFIKNADFLTEEQKRDILYNNAARFLRLPEDQMKQDSN